MSAKLIEGGPIAEKIKEEVRSAVAGMAKPPKLAAVLATDNPGAKFYAKSQASACEEVGIEYELHDPERTGPLGTSDEMKAYIRKLNGESSLTGVILLMPVPDGVDAREVQLDIAPEKDVEGVHPANIGRLFYGDFSLAPCTAHAVLRMLQEAEVDLKGQETVVVGHSEIVGKPALVMLLRSVMESPTVTSCHIATRDLASHTKRADILVVAAGKAGLVKGAMVKPGAVVIDVGINRVKVEDGGKKKTRIVGDVEFDAAKEVASAITPVPGGVGMVTTALLLANVVECARRQQ
ncbi:MAG: bifunctional 5,10-methylenetetrahydrofolate dehydrogenase/5,10-methenyltetrahydrofolate cyclohydrolase [Candidatus Brocadiia bacterium]|jgi:methylenetetrahydrofolate dehydrogenase (NADP+)/methenyltetrahydrofolate cyclohydrolase|nr:bifunctional 5,10-methylenetetrahydrofolate dehydrogenase/5,10-methenyltetrahydrofolate cyclohydrolase [Candidatus Brocadiia bacterium]